MNIEQSWLCHFVVHDSVKQKRDVADEESCEEVAEEVDESCASVIMRQEMCA